VEEGKQKQVRGKREEEVQPWGERRKRRPQSKHRGSRRGKEEGEGEGRRVRCPAGRTGWKEGWEGTRTCLEGRRESMGRLWRAPTKVNGGGRSTKRSNR
jgi:hypothetical protein